MAQTNRDDFSPTTKVKIAKRAGGHCADPSCRRLTNSANSDGTGEINLGIAAHICAAASGGPRYDPNQTPAQRSSVENGIWMCRLHGTAVDANDSKFTVELLREWQAQSWKDSWRANLYGEGPLAPASRTPTEGELGARVRAAAAADLEVFRRSEKWPLTAVALTLEVDGLSGPVSTSAVGTALTTLDDLVLVAPPGMGKTATLFQIAEAALANGNASPIVIPLGDWSTDNAALLESVVKRPAFLGISEGDLRAVAEKPGVTLLLDGWNELDAVARGRLRVQVARLQAELPELSLLISTRKQVLDVPVTGTRINLLPLDETQQLSIAKALRGDAGVRILDQARRTSGVRELITIPLYFTALLALPEGAPFPATKEDVLRRFVAVHEEDQQRAEALAKVTQGFHQRLLEDLAATATRTATTTIPEAVARQSVSGTEGALVAQGQLTDKPQPNTVLEALVSYHILLRIGGPAGYSFQHQQFQEWYASFEVERCIRAAVDDPENRTRLRVQILDILDWEEPILFACERMSRGDLKQQEACGAAILAAFEVDPMLAAEMIFRSTDAMWARVGSPIQKLIERWHTPGTVDRAVRFMISSGRPEFFNHVWPLITHENNQVHLVALRAGRRFRPSLLGNDAAKRIASLPPAIRKNVLHEIAFNSGMDGLDLAATIAKNDTDPEVKEAVISALAFRGADRHVADVLRGADERTFDLVIRHDLVDEATDEHVKKGMEAARERQRKEGVSAYDRLKAIVHAQGYHDLSGEVTTIVAEMEIDKNRDAAIDLLYRARSRYSRAIADGLRQRVRAGRSLFYGADDLLAAAGFSVEDEGLLEIALSETSRHDVRAEAAASVLGPQAVGRLIDTVLDGKTRLRDANGRYNDAAGDRYHDLLDRIGHTPGTSLAVAVQARSAQAGTEEMAELADLIARHPAGEDDSSRPFDADALAMIHALAEDWGNRMLASGDATRSQFASVASLVGRAPSVALLPLLKRLLDEDLRRWCAFKAQARAKHYRGGTATNEARTSWTLQYQRAFQAIGGLETTALMREYLTDVDFGKPAAVVIAHQWTTANEPRDGERSWGRVDFSRVEENRAARARDPADTSAEAEAIFHAIEPLIADETTEEQKKHAVALGVVAARLPHGQRDATIHKLISLASRQSRAALLRNLILSGETVNIELVKNGIAEVFEAGKTQSWILSDGYELADWLRLLPFASPVSEASTIVRGLPADQRRADRLEEMIASFRTAPGDAAETVLFQLAQDDPTLYGNHVWLDAAIGQGTLSSARRFVDLAVNGAFQGRGTDHWYLVKQLGGLIGEHPEIRSHLYQLLRHYALTPGLTLLAHAVAEHPDADGLVLLVEMEMEHKGSFISRRTIAKVVTEQIPSESWTGTYHIVPVPAVKLRRTLLAMTRDSHTDAAARCLKQIDEIRDEYGTPDSEPRHPDIHSGLPWPPEVAVTHD